MRVSHTYDLILDLYKISSKKYTRSLGGKYLTINDLMHVIRKLL